MLERPPREPEALSWLFVGAWALFVFLSIPFVRTIVNFVRDTWGRDLFTYVVAAAICLAALFAVKLLRGRAQSSKANYFWLAGVVVVFLFYTWDLKDNPEEAVHFIEYGVLSVLIYRALTHRIRDYSIYPAAALIATSFGILDETIQWLIPDRFWDYRDIWLNFSAGALVLFGLATGLRPPLISGAPGAASIRRLFRLALIPAVALAITYINTPTRMETYAELIHIPDVIQVSGDKMAEYGYYHEDPDVGAFRSRMTPEQLQAIDRQQAATAAAIVDRYPDREAYRAFLKLYPVGRNDFLHEVRVHIFRRDVYLARADEAAAGSPERSDYLTIAYWENRILEKYFGQTLAASTYNWTPDTKDRVETGADRNFFYESPVSRSLITSVNEIQMFAAFAALIAVLLFGALYRRRKPA